MKFLVIIDMQNDFITGALGSKEAQMIVDDIVRYAENFNGHIIATMDTHSKDWYLKTQEGRKLPVEHCIKNTPGWCLEDRIFDVVGTTIEKSTFGSTELANYIEDYVKRDNYNKVYLCGVCTDICVVSNALLLKAMYPEINIKVLEDLCAGTTPENHEAALKVMESCQIERVISREEI